MQILGAQLSYQSQENETTFDLTMDQEVTVTESFYPPFSPLTFFTVMGGALGLWLGVGVVQVVSYLVTAVAWLRRSVLQNELP